MCGIAGKIFLKQGHVTASELKVMSDKIIHRGPDDGGTYVSKNRKVGLANRRLAIIDLTKGGHQPMSLKGRYWITFNGEIYNFQEEKKKLEKQGYKFRSNSDTEVILALYDKYKTGCLKHLRGMFAFAIYDEREKTVFLARDRIGKKPLKYYWDGNLFCFASELKAILTQKEVRRQPDWLAIHHFLTYGYLPSPFTGFSNIYKLSPSHYLLVDLTKQTIEVNKYWSLDFTQKLDLSEKEWCGRILDTLEESTRLRLISDVPIGAFLSGGVDSSGVVATMASLSTSPIKTFSIGFKEAKHSELKYARNIAKMYKTDHTELTADVNAIETLPEIVYQYEEPYADGSAVVTFMVSKLAREWVTVILNGDGGDENFAGYNRHFRLKRDALWDEYKEYLLPLVSPLMGALSESASYGFFGKVQRFLEKSKKPIHERFVSYNSYFANSDKDEIYGSFLREITKGIDSQGLAAHRFLESGSNDVKDQALYFDLFTYLPEDLLAKVDIASMRYSLEGRSPFLDHKMLELAAQIPYELKVKGKEGKYILKKALEKIVPKENLYRPKQGFSIPWAEWFEGDLNKYSSGILLGKDSVTKNLFNQKLIKKMLKTHSRVNDFGPKLWALTCIELWFREFFS